MSGLNLQLRTSYFPGLGWMLQRALWQELRPQWPAQAWDHWMRLPSTAKGVLPPCFQLLLWILWHCKNERCCSCHCGSVNTCSAT